MKTLRVVLNVSTALLLASTAICGLWLRSQGATVDPSSIGFHMTIGLLTVVVGLVALGLSTFARMEPGRSRADGERTRPMSSSEALVRGR